MLSINCRKSHQIFSKHLINYSRNKTTEANDVIFENINGKGILTLNRPSQLNALNQSIVTKCLHGLQQWENEKTIVIAKGVPGKAFCAGGDLMFYIEHYRDFKKYAELYKTQTILNNLISTYKIPYVALMDGIIMGAGCGLSVLGRYRIATENTVFSMPEVHIGYFPDAATCNVLPKLCGQLGTYLVLTGDRLYGAELARTGIATHFCRSSKLIDLEKAILDVNDIEELDSVLKSFNETDVKEFRLTPYMNKINDYFSSESIKQIMRRLENDRSDWAKKILSGLLKSSPTSLEITFKLLQLEKNMSIQESLETEYALCKNVVRKTDLYEGIRAFLYKDRVPLWNPKSILDVTPENIEEYFAKTLDFEKFNWKR